MLGILSSKPAKVKLTVNKKIDDEKAQKTTKRVTEVINEFFKIIGENDVDYSFGQAQEEITLNIKSESLSYLIGYRGRTIEAFQSIINSILRNESDEYLKIFVEIDDYKKNKEEKLKDFARKMADNVIKYKKPIKLEPMSSYERMLIHKELSLRDDVTTESIGEEPRRRVVIKKKY